MRLGFILTTDALLAVLVSMFLAISSIALLNRAEGVVDYPTLVLDRLSSDALLAMEKTSVLSRAVEQNRTDELHGVMNGFPENFCGELAVYRSNGSLLLAAYQVGCGCDRAEDMVVARRSFISRADGAMQLNYAELAGCYR